LQVLFGEDRKSRSSDCFFFCIGNIRFDLAMHMMFSSHIAFVFNKIYIYIGENLQDIFGISDIACIFS
jgi:hypothetical protein